MLLPLLELVPLALGIAASPIAVMVVILMLVAPGGRRTAAVYVLGWLGGVLAVAAIVLAVVDVAAEADAGETGWVGPAIKVVLGVALLVLAAREWRKRPGPGAIPELPGWMQSIESIRPGRALVLGATFAAVKPKNLVLAAAAGTAIAAAELATAPSVVLLVVFAVMASASVGLPLVAVLVMGEGAGPALERWKAWLGANSSALVAVVLVVLGLVLLVQGIGSLR